VFFCQHTDLPLDYHRCGPRDISYWFFYRLGDLVHHQLFSLMRPERTPQFSAPFAFFSFPFPRQLFGPGVPRTPLRQPLRSLPRFLRCVFFLSTAMPLTQTHLLPSPPRYRTHPLPFQKNVILAPSGTLHSSPSRRFPADDTPPRLESARQGFGHSGKKCHAPRTFSSERKAPPFL